METKKILDSVFEGHNLTTAVWDGKMVWLASEISLALGYKNSHKVPNLIRQEWADEFVEDEHFSMVKRANVRDDCRFAEPHYGSANVRTRSDEFVNTKLGFTNEKTRHLMLLTEPGVDLVILKTSKRHKRPGPERKTNSICSGDA